MHWFLENAFIASALALLLAAILRVARPRPALAHALWLVVLVRLVVPTPLDWPEAWTIRLSASDASPDAALAYEKEASEMEARDAKDSRGERAPLLVPTSELVHESGSAAHILERRQWNRILVGVWLAGVLIQLVREARRRAPLRQAFAASGPRVRPRALLDAVALCAKRMQIAPPRVVCVPGLRAPLVAGLRRPVLAWPADLAVRANDPGLYAVVSHELAHLARRDLWVAHLEALIGALCWWNPLVPWMRAQLRAAAEESCDAWAVWLWPSAARAYATTLLAVSARERCVPGVARSTANLPSAALAVVRSGGRALRRRLVGILAEPTPASLGSWGRGVALVFCTAALPGLGATSDQTRNDWGPEVHARVERDLLVALEAFLDGEPAPSASLVVVAHGELVHELEYGAPRSADSAKQELSARELVAQRTIERPATDSWRKCAMDDGREVRFEVELHGEVRVCSAYSPRDAVGIALVTPNALAMTHLEDSARAILARVVRDYSIAAAPQRALARADYRAAFEGFAALAREDPTRPEWEHRLGFCLIALGRDAEALPHLERSLDAGFLPAISAYNLACAHAKLGTVDAGLLWLERAVELGFASPAHLDEDPDLSALRGDERFAALRQRIALNEPG